MTLSFRRKPDSTLFPNYIDFRAKDTEPPAPGPDTYGAGFAGVTSIGFFALVWEFRSFFHHSDRRKTNNRIIAH